MGFVECKAPMTAKCVIRDVLRRSQGVTMNRSQQLTALIVSELRQEGYEIAERKK